MGENNVHSVHEDGKEKSSVVPQVNVQIIHEGSKITFNEENGKYYKCQLCEEKILKAFSKANTKAKLEAHLRNNHRNKYKCDTAILEDVKNTIGGNNIDSVHEDGEEKSNSVHHLLPQVNVQIIKQEGSIIIFKERGKFYK